MIKRVTKDFETRSEVELKKEGAYKYSLHPSTRPTCLAFKAVGDPMVYFLNFQLVNTPWKDLPQKVRDIWTRYILEGYQMSAHNSFFERCIYDNIMVPRYGWPKIPPRQRRCTAAKCAAAALPRNLADAGTVLKLATQKYGPGYQAMMATCKPTRKYNDWQKMKAAIAEREARGRKLTPKQTKWLAAAEPCPPMFLEPEAGPDVFAELYKYCKIDVRTEELVDLALPDLIPSELEIWHHNQMLNWRGLRADIPTVKKITEIMAEESKHKLKELDALTMGLVTKPHSRQSVLDFLALEGIELPNLRKNTVEEKLEGFELSDDMRRLLEIRQALTMTSTKKYHSFLQRAAPDDRIRDLTLYHGASTGRDTGTGIQPHNFPRGLIKVSKNRPYAAVMNVIGCDPDTLKLLYGESLGVLFSALLRNMIIASEGHELYVADFSKIEVAVVWWLSGNEAGLQILREGKDPYIYQAAENLGKTYEEIEAAVNAEEPWALDARQLGKAQILGCGFGMGAPKFQRTAWDLYRVKLSLKQSKEAVKAYREANSPVPDLWLAFEGAALHVVKKGGVKTVGHCKFIYDPKKYYGGLRILWLELPSGRRLAYADPQIAWRVRTYDVIEIDKKTGEEILVAKTSNPMETLEFWAVNSKTKKWNLERTWGGTLVQGATQATARDLMMPGLLRLEKRGYKGLLSVHDEGITEKKIGEGSIEEFVEILCQVPPWATGMPISAKGWSGPRYRKG